MTLVQKEPKSIKIWTTDIKKVYLGSTQVRPKPRTFTISWTEQSNMSSWWTYSDDAAWLTAGSTDFDEFFGYSWVRLNASWVETAEITQTASGWAGKLDITQLWTLTSWDNVMIKFPVRWIKMTKSWSVVTLSITEELNKAWYQYYAFQNTWNVDTNTENTPTKQLYLGAYFSIDSSGYARSRSWWTSTSWFTLTDAITKSTNNGTGWTVMWWYQWNLINAMYMMKYGNPDAAWVIWLGTYNGGNGSTDVLTNATGTANNAVRLFWLENRWRRWGYWAILWWVFSASQNWHYWAALHWFYWNPVPTNYNYKFIWTLWGWTPNWLKSIKGNNKEMFAAAERWEARQWNTYYRVEQVYGTNTTYPYYVPVVWCRYASDGRANILSLLFIMLGNSDSHPSRLMYL